MRLVCVICTELFGIDSNISVVHCGHLFHEDCLSRWLNSGQNSCPNCIYNCNHQSVIKNYIYTNPMIYQM